MSLAPPKITPKIMPKRAVMLVKIKAPRHISDRAIATAMDILAIPAIVPARDRAVNCAPKARIAPAVVDGKKALVIMAPQARISRSMARVAPMPRR